jgi:hypothetical protein
MANKDPFLEFLEARDKCVENLLSLRTSILQCAEDQQIDVDDALYEKTTICLDGAPLLESWEEIAELVFQGKILEAEVDAWLSVHKLTSYSLTWPSAPKRQ